MIRHRTLSVVALLLFGAFALNGCTLLRGGSKTPPVFGTWQYTMQNPSEGTLTGRMIIAEGEEEGTYTGNLTVDEMGINEAMNIQSLEIDDPSFVMTAVAAGYQFTVTGVIDGDTLTGENNVSGVGIWAMEATRVVEE